DYISKPFNTLELLARVNIHLQLKKNEDVLRQKNRQLEELNKKKNMLLGIAAHDLRNPLMNVMGVVELYKMKYEDQMTEDHEKILGIIDRSVTFMTNLVNDLLDYSVIESGNLVMNMEVIDIVKIVKENISYHKNLAERKKISLELLCSENLPGSIVADEHKIVQVINNLIVNAVKFSHPGTRIEVHMEYKDESILFFVKDQGKGIPRDDRDKIFTAFCKTNARGTAGERSTGLGLAIVRNIVNGHNGRIWLDSELGKGTTFYVLLPVDPGKNS
ncbi:MAG: HAMP domain-containing histidine kinase, partial [bacterium]|nr:HAMP domain-containing histidine kinase [bacterium]